MATLADLRSRNVMKSRRKCTGVDTLPVWDKQWIVWEMKWPFAVADNQLKGGKHLTQGLCRIVIRPGEDALCGIPSGQKKHLCIGRIHPQ